jgi:hypothetical protein
MKPQAYLAEHDHRPGAGVVVVGESAIEGA